MIMGICVQSSSFTREVGVCMEESGTTMLGNRWELSFPFPWLEISPFLAALSQRREVGHKCSSGECFPSGKKYSEVGWGLYPLTSIIIPLAPFCALWSKYRPLYHLYFGSKNYCLHFTDCQKCWLPKAQRCSTSKHPSSSLTVYLLNGTIFQCCIIVNMVSSLRIILFYFLFM